MALIGIDLGTTFAAMATMENGAVVEIDNHEGNKTTPSVVFFPTDDIRKAIVGQSAVLAAGTAPDRTAQFVKRQMGTDFRMRVGAAEYAPEEVSAAVLRKLKDDAEAFLAEPVEGAVLAVPAHFNASEREATRKAAELAGLKVLSILDEPIAAAIDFAHSRGENLAGKTVLVYHLGGGTLDLTVIRFSQPGGPGAELGVEVVGAAGSRELGGADFDQALARHVAAEFRAAHGKNVEDDANGFYVLIQRCQLAKQDLSTSESSTVQCHHDGVAHAVTVTRAKFEELIEPLLNETADKLAILVADTAARTRDDPRPVSWETIDHVLLTGGSARIPCVADLVERVAGRKPVVSRNPDMHVARGAAYAAFRPDVSGARPATSSERRSGEEAPTFQERKFDGRVAKMASSRPQQEPVRFTVTAPRSVAAGHSYVLQVWAHLEAQSREVITRARAAQAEAGLWTETRHGVPLAPGTVLSMRLHLPGFVTPAPREELVWYGDASSASFVVRVPADIKPGPHAGTVTVRAGGLRVARLHFVVQAGRKPPAPSRCPVEPITTAPRSPPTPAATGRRSWPGSRASRRSCPSWTSSSTSCPSGPASAGPSASWTRSPAATSSTCSGPAPRASPTGWSGSGGRRWRSGASTTSTPSRWPLRNKYRRRRNSPTTSTSTIGF